MSKTKPLEKFRAVLFDGSSTLSLSNAELAQLTRYRDAYTQWLEEPSLSETQMRDYLMNNHFISKSQAYRDLHNIKILLGNVKTASRSWIQHVVNETLLETITKLKGDSKRIKELIMAVDKLAKYNQLHQDAPLDIPWDEIIPMQVEPTSDPSILGIKPMADLQKIKADLYKKYGDDIEIEDTTFVDVTEDDE